MRQAREFHDPIPVPRIKPNSQFSGISVAAPSETPRTNSAGICSTFRIVSGVKEKRLTFMVDRFSFISEGNEIV
jgi:hypothetical protein